MLRQRFGKAKLFLQDKKYMILPRLPTNRPVSWPRIKAEVLWRLRDRA
ncbi:hypothetical protein NBRC111894_3977 [Sporolactobacillus inulinus]|uniref:Uncharacterized protein n=1 Tax=Sporolactobacillus inulinus TaxID=2078 RepID=A0A4Y1ZHI8_9BACL|nr:hypothetical protein NBRC111894_3977 [Sporolactobacillus inulinus]